MATATMSELEMPTGETVTEFPEQAMKPKYYDYEAMAALEMPYRFTLPDRRSAQIFRNTIYRHMRARGIQVRLFNRFVFLRSQENHCKDCEPLTK